MPFNVPDSAGDATLGVGTSSRASLEPGSSATPDNFLLWARNGLKRLKPASAGDKIIHRYLTAGQQADSPPACAWLANMLRAGEQTEAPALVYRGVADTPGFPALADILAQGLPANPARPGMSGESRHKVLAQVDRPVSLTDLLPRKRKQLLTTSRALALYHSANADGGYGIMSYSPNIAVGNDYAGANAYVYAVNTATATRITGYPFERPGTIMRQHGGRLLDQGLAWTGLFEEVARFDMGYQLLSLNDRQLHGGEREIAFLGPHLPPEAIEAVFHKGKQIWRRPSVLSQSEGSATRYERILNIQLSSDPQVQLAADYLRHKHPGQSVSYQLEVAHNTLAVVRPTGTNAAPATLARLNLIGRGAGATAGNTLAGWPADQLAERLLVLIQHEQQSGCMAPGVSISLDFIVCEATLEQVEVIARHFNQANINLDRASFRGEPVMVDTLGRKLQRSNEAWLHSHAKTLVTFDEEGEILVARTHSAGTDATRGLTVVDAAGPLGARADAIVHAHALREAIARVTLQAGLDSSWTPMLQALTLDETGNSRLRLQQPGAPEREIVTQDAQLAAYQRFVARHAGEIARHHAFDGERFSRIGRVGPAAGELNRRAGSFFALQTLVAFALSGKDSTNAVTPTLQAHVYLNLAQSVHALGADGVDAINALKQSFQSVAAGGSTMAAPASPFGRAFGRLAREGVGTALGIASLGFDIHELIGANTAQERTRAGVRLGLDGTAVGVALTEASLVLAGVEGAAVATGPFALLVNVLAFGVDLGFMLVDDIRQQQHEAAAVEAVAKYFGDLQQAYAQGAAKFDPASGVLRFDPLAVIVRLNLPGQPGLVFDSQYLPVGNRKFTANLTVGVDHAVPTYRVHITDDPVVMLSVRESMGILPESTLRPDMGNATIIVLPGTPSSRIIYSYGRLNRAPTRSGHGYDLMARLETFIPGRGRNGIVFRKGNLALDRLQQIYQHTRIEVRLDAAARILIVPPVATPAMAGTLHYQLEGAGGYYRVVMSASCHVVLSAAATGGANSTWLIDLTKLDDIDDFLCEANHAGLTFGNGGIRIDMNGVMGTLYVKSTTRLWWFDPQRGQLRLMSLDMSGIEQPGSMGAFNQHRSWQFAATIEDLRDADPVEIRRQLINAIIDQLERRGSPACDFLRLDNVPEHVGLDCKTAIVDVQNRRLVASGLASADRSSLSPVRFMDQLGDRFYYAGGSHLWAVDRLGLIQIRLQLMPDGDGELSSIGQQADLLVIRQRIVLSQPGISFEACYHYGANGIPTLVRLVLPAGLIDAQPGSGSAQSLAAVLEWLRTPVTPSAFAGSTSAVILAPAVQLCDATSPGTTPSAWVDGASKAICREQGGLIHARLDSAVPVLVSVTAAWMRSHRVTWKSALPEVVAGGAPSIAIEGFVCLNGRARQVWFHRPSGQFIVAPETLAGQTLTLMDASVSASGAWLFAGSTRQLYLQALCSAEFLAQAFDDEGRARFSTARFDAAREVLGSTPIKDVAAIGGGRLAVSTVAGLLLVLDPASANRPALVGVRRDSLPAEPTALHARLTRLGSDTAFLPHWHLALLSDTQPGWFDMSSGSVVWLNQVDINFDFIGVDVLHQLAYFWDAPHQVLFSKAMQAGADAALIAVEGSFLDVFRHASVLSVRFSPRYKPALRHASIPDLAGVDTLVPGEEGGEGQRFTIERPMWARYQDIVLGLSADDGAHCSLSLDFVPSAALVATREVDTLVLHTTAPDSHRISLSGFFHAGNAQPFTVHYPDGTSHRLRRKAFGADGVSSAL